MARTNGSEARKIRAKRTYAAEIHPQSCTKSPYFVALKIEAFEERGRRDFLCSTDFEDIICLFNGRDSIVEEIAGDENLAEPLARKFAEYLKSPELEDAIDGFVQTETETAKRKAAIISRFKLVAALAQT